MPPIHNVYLKIEEIADYSPVEPSPHAAANYRRDCMRNPGHEDAKIPLSEVQARELDALIYREYLDAGYTIPKPDKLIQADVNEPVFPHRVPGTVIYTRPGEHLHIHVLNGDVMPHSFHVHGLRYGIESDGSWPLGTQATDGRRSDEICPGQTWIYHFDVTEEMVGAWPFHEHYRMIGESVNRGLFGGIVVLPEECDPPRRFELPPLVEEFRKRRVKDGEPAAHDAVGGHMHGGPGPIVDQEAYAVQLFLEEWAQLAYAHPKIEDDDRLHVPVFIHQMVRTRGVPTFDSGPFPPGALPFEVQLGAEATYTYHCEIHPSMQGKIVVAAGEGPEQVVTINDTDPLNMKFVPAEARIRPGGKVRWTSGTTTHIIVDDGAGFPSFCLNGRSFVGNTPTIVANAGQRIRWYVFNLDLSMGWHNFHVHGQRFHFGGTTMDTRSLGPAESFVVDTVAPPALLLPEDIEESQEHHPRGAKKYLLRGDFLFHCHVEMHMMQGLAGVVRSRQTVWLTDEQKKRLESTVGLPLDDAMNNCPDVALNHCEIAECGHWELVAGSPSVCMMHAAPIPNTLKLLFYGYGDTRDDLSRIWDYSTPAGAFSVPPNQPFDVTVPVHNRPLANIWSSEHAFLSDAKGTLLVHGGFTPRQAFLFDPVALTWSLTNATADNRFYSTTLTLSDGRLLTLFGSSSKSLEVYDPGTGTWSAPAPFPPSMSHHVFYPWTYLLPDGKLFIAGPHVPTQRFDWTPAVANVESFATNAGNRSSGGEKGTSVLLPLRPPLYAPSVLIAGGDPAPAQKTAEIIDLSAATPTWTYTKTSLNFERALQVNTVLLPDGRVLLAGGIDGADGGAAEIFDPRNPDAGWQPCATMSIPRGYHSAAILLADGSVLMGGDKPGQWKSGETTQHERYFPSYYNLPRPQITAAPGNINYGVAFNVTTPSPASIAEVVLVRPGAVTHGFNMSQRLIECTITGTTATDVQVKVPANKNIAPPGPYLLFILTASRIPSVARWVRLM